MKTKTAKCMTTVAGQDMFASKIVKMMALWTSAFKPG